MGVGHGHSHGNTQGSGEVGPSRGRIRRMVIALVILLAFLVLEVVVGLTVNSLALLADAGHMLTDVVGMSMGLVALLLARKGSTTAARTFGWHRAEVLTAMANAAMLLAVAIWVFYEAISRIGDVPELPGMALILTASVGLAANLVVMLMLRADSKDSLAVRAPTSKCSRTPSAVSACSSPAPLCWCSTGPTPTSSSASSSHCGWCRGP